MMSHIARCVVPLAMTCVLQAPQASPHQHVHVDVTVSRADGSPLTGLAVGDFNLLTEGRVLPITSFTVGRRPLQIVLLLDLTASVTRGLPRRVLESDVTSALIDALGPDEHLRIGGFGSDLVLGGSLTAERRRLREDLRAAMDHPRDRLYGPSPIWDFTLRGLESFPAPEARRALVLVSDGRATGNTRGIGEVAETAIRRGVAINVVGQDLEYQVQQDATTAVRVQPGNALQWLSTVTGGAYVAAAAYGQPPAAALKPILASLRQTYTLTFGASISDDRLYPLEVQVKRTNVKIGARRLFAPCLGSDLDSPGVIRRPAR